MGQLSTVLLWCDGKTPDTAALIRTVGIVLSITVESATNHPRKRRFLELGYSYVALIVACRFLKALLYLLPPITRGNRISPIPPKGPTRNTNTRR